MRRRPDVEAPNLFAVDAADRLILDTAAEALSNAQPGTVVVIGDAFGALTLGSIVGFGAEDVRVHQDPLTGEAALDNNARPSGLDDRYRHCAFDRALLEGAQTVLLRLPRGLAELGEIADAVARFADPAVQVFAGGRDKHITPAMNDVLGQSFHAVQAGRGRQKSRVLTVSGPRELGATEYPVSSSIPELNLTVIAHGAVFSGAKLDLGTRYLLEFLPRMKADASNAMDLGCGTGILAVELARARPGLVVHASDQSAAAVASARATARANDVEIAVTRDDAMASVAAASLDLIVCNPPFHVGAAVHTGAAEKLFAAAGRVLGPGGEMWTVYNTHLNYRVALAQAVGPTNLIGQNGKFTVARSRRAD